MGYNLRKQTEDRGWSAATNPEDSLRHDFERMEADEQKLYKELLTDRARVREVARGTLDGSGPVKFTFTPKELRLMGADSPELWKIIHEQIKLSDYEVSLEEWRRLMLA